MPNTRNRVIIDTNLWISFLLTKDLSKFETIFSDKLVTLVFSNELIEEFLEVTQRVKFRKYFDIGDTEALLLKITNRAISVDVSSVIILCRDPKDNFLLSLAVDARATHLITGDKDLLILENIGETKILNMADYIKTL